MRSQQVAWFADKDDAVKLEATLYAEALKAGQVCDKWAEIIEDKVLGFGVPVKDRIKSAMSADEVAKVAEYTPEDVPAKR